MATGRVNVGGGGAGLNIFTQMSEPATKEGIWLKTSEKHNKVAIDDKIWLANEWNDTDVVTLPDTLRVIAEASCVEHQGKIYFIGGVTGYSASGTLNSCVCYDTATNKWATLAAAPANMAKNNAVVYNNKIYIHGGYSNANSLLSNMYCYDIATNTWTTLATGAGGRQSHSLTLVKDKIYIIGGFANSASSYQSNVVVYDITNNTYTNLGVQINRAGHRAHFINNRIYLIGGAVLSTNASNINTYLDLTDNTVHSIANSPEVMGGHTSQLIGGNIYVLGGDTTISSSTGYTARDTIYIYNISTDTWSLSEKTVPFNVSRASTAYVNDRIYLFGGIYSTNSLRNSRFFAFVSKPFTDKSIVILKTSYTKGDYSTELVTPNTSIVGDSLLKRLLTNFNDVFFYVNSDLKSLESYYGNGTQWIKFKEARV